MVQSARQWASDASDRGRDEANEQTGTQSYDFRTGSELSREALSQIRVYAERLATGLGRIINAYLDSPARFEVRSVEGKDMEPFLEELPQSCAVGLIDLEGALPQILWELDQELVGPVVFRMLGGEPEAIERPATMLEAALLRRFIQEMVEVWTTSWDRLARQNPEVMDVATGAVALRGKVRDRELVTVELAASLAGTDGAMRVALPVAVAQRLVSDRDRSEEARALNAERLRASGERIVVPISVILQETTISLREATELSEGDVIPLGKPVDEPMTVCVRGKRKFLAQTGTRGGRLAAQLLGPVGETSQ